MSIKKSQSEQTDAIAFSQAEYDEDERDALEDEMGFELQNPDASFRGARSVLLVKLAACPHGDFNVIGDSRYNDTSWALNAGNVVKFHSNLPGVNDLKRAIMFHLLPEYHPWGGARSHNTVHVVGYAFGLIEKYVFAENRLNATAGHLRAVDAMMLNYALDKARDSGFLTTYKNLYFFLRYWMQLSTQKFIPESLRLNVAVSQVITKERESDIVERLRGAAGIYRPFGEDELSKLIEYALFWTEKAMPALLKVRKVLLDEGVDKGHSKIKTQIASRAEFFEKNLTVVVDGVVVMRPNVNYYERVPKGQTKLATYWDITWVRPYAQMLDSVRNAVFIWVSLITGARKRELGILTEENLLFDEHTGEYSVRVTRFKTTNDPDFNGKEDILPLPTVIGDYVRDYLLLRDVRAFSKVKALFGSHNHVQLGKTKSAHNAYQTIESITQQLQDSLMLEGIHCHRFRKTIAEILINRDERNIDIIRLLFGHTSYAMTLRYIARNPYFVRSVVQAIENGFTDDFAAIVSGLRSGVYAGDRAAELAGRLASRESLFAGKMIRAEIHEYVSHLIRSGEAIYIHRTSLGAGAYCLATEGFSTQHKPPCIEHLAQAVGNLPNPRNCQVECENLILLESAKVALHQNIAFYSKLLSSNSLKERIASDLTQKLLASERRLREIEVRSAPGGVVTGLVRRGLS